MHRYTKIGLWMFLVCGLIHFSARQITWPSFASWGNQVEATKFYSQQKSLEVICEHLILLSVGMILIGLWEARKEVSKKGSCIIPSELKEEEKDGFVEWMAEDLSRKYLDQGAQVEKYRRDLSK